MLDINSIIAYLKEYNGAPVTFMEVCGTHTASIAKNGIRSMLSDKIRLVSGPGCPVCVTVSDYIDKLCELSMQNRTVVATFGDMIRVPGSRGSLYDARSSGGHVHMLYSPFDLIKLAAQNKDKTYIFAAVGFETTTPVYALLMDQIINENIQNIKLLTSLKTMPAAIDWVCRQNSEINGFLAPGHVCTITGSDMFLSSAEKYKMPFVVAGFEGEQVLAAIYALVKNAGRGKVINLYRSAVDARGNGQAQDVVKKYFVSGTASWRGLGEIADSGLYLRDEYAEYDAGSRGLNKDEAENRACRCGEVLIGKLAPRDCPLFGKMCTPNSPKGACMVSGEGSCYNAYCI